MVCNCISNNKYFYDDSNYECLDTCKGRVGKEFYNYFTSTPTTLQQCLSGCNGSNKYYNFDSNVCLTQGLLTNFTKQGSIIWYFIISYTCLINTLNSKYYLQNKVKFTIIFLLCSLLIPFIYCLYLYFFDLIGNDI